METTPVQTPPPLLQYADMPAGMGIILEPLSDGVRITRPPSHAEATALLILALVFSPLIILLVFFAQSPDPITHSIRAIRRKFRPTIIEVTPTTLSMLNVEMDGAGPKDITHPRADVYDVRYVSHSNNVVVRIHGQEMVELHPFKDPRMQRWLANTLVQALRLK